MSTPGDTFLSSFFYRQFIIGSTLNTTPPTAVRLKTSNAQIITPTGGYYSPTKRAGMVDTSMEAAAAPHQSEPNESAACSGVSSADYVDGCFRDQPAYVTGTVAAGTMFDIPPTVPKAPTTDDDAGSNFVANHGRYRVPLYRYLENEPVCNNAVYNVLGVGEKQELQGRQSTAVRVLAERSL